MIQLPDIIDAVDIFMNSDTEGIDKIASKVDSEIEVPFEDEVSQLSSDQFACVIKTAEKTFYKFPINTKDNTTLNVQAILHTHNTLPDEIVKTASANLLRAAKFWKIDEGLEELEKLSGNVTSNFVNADRVDMIRFNEKTSSGMSSTEYSVFALNAKYPIDTPELLKEAEKYYIQYSNRFSPLERHEYATNIIKQAEIVDYQITTPKILKHAHLRFERNPHLKELLLARDKQACTDGAYKEISKLANSVDLEKLAEAIFELDTEFGLTEHYDKQVPDPVFTVFTSIEKTAETFGGKNISLENLQALSKDKLENLSLTSDAIDELHGDSGLDVLRSLPDPISEQIIDLL